MSQESKKATALQSCGIAAVTAVMVVNVTHPIDTFKTRLQADSGFKVGAMVRNEGVSAFYKGIQAAWCREGLYTTFKLGAYPPLRDFFSGDKESTLLTKFAAGACTGGFGSILGNPFDLLRVKLMTSDGWVPMRKVAGEMYAHQGIGGFYRGLEANVSRAVILNAVKMSTYDTSKTYIKQYTGWTRKDPRCQLGASAIAGFAMAVATAPADFMRTRLMNQPADKKLYNGMLDGVMKIYKSEGFVFYRGFWPIYARFVPMATLQLLIFENISLACGFSSI